MFGATLSCVDFTKYLGRCTAPFSNTFINTAGRQYPWTSCVFPPCFPTSVIFFIVLCSSTLLVLHTRVPLSITRSIKVRTWTMICSTYRYVYHLCLEGGTFCGWDSLFERFFKFQLTPIKLKHTTDPLWSQKHHIKMHTLTLYEEINTNTIKLLRKHSAASNW